ncbi:MAG: hypothetical protein AB7E67_15845 [Xanthobacteraceae bacterium]
MILNADTFMVVVSALQSLGDNPIAAPVGITSGGPTTTPASGGSGAQAAGISISGGNVTFPPASAVTGARGFKNNSAEMASRIVRDYLEYRYRLARINERERVALARKRAATKTY